MAADMDSDVATNVVTWMMMWLPMALFGSRYNCSALGIVITLTTNYGVKQSQFANRLHLVLHACEILFSENVRASFVAKPNKASVSACSSEPNGYAL